MVDKRAIWYSLKQKNTYWPLGCTVMVSGFGQTKEVEILQDNKSAQDRARTYNRAVRHGRLPSPQKTLKPQRKPVEWYKCPNCSCVFHARKPYRIAK
jgi:hypothetical protein